MAQLLAAHKVLVVEDDSDIREALVSILENEGYRVAGAGHGLEALELLKSDPEYCLILLDLMLPVMNGWQFRAEQRRDPTLSDVPVVVISADNSLDLKAAAMDAAAYLKKPISLEALLDTVERYC